MSDFPRKLRAYPGDPTTVITRSYIEEIAAHIERVESELADGRLWLEARAAVLKELAETKAELAAERERAGKLDEACRAGIRLMATTEDALRECQEQRDKLREALGPFAVEADKRAFKYDDSSIVRFELRHCRRARAVLAETKGDGDE